MVITYSAYDIKHKQLKNFYLLETKSGKQQDLKEFFSDIGTVIMFICNHCPFVQHINNQLIILSNEYINKNISFISINSNDIKQYPEDSPENMHKVAHKLGYPFPYFFDKTQEVAKYYGATCTPEFFIFDKYQNLCYYGQFDDSRPGNNIPVSGISIQKILDNILTNKKIKFIKKPSQGCNIKWTK
ncbi:thioredoxin family protein [Blattabacterium cuenoti]|uniref:thioredoxin family protein n=1 Tax=Blattabacterium cuenoti TaxID=1653831 RepID=UPI00163C9398|nr:thioredoxin family protein [Blattabacterium cuenoti]